MKRLIAILIVLALTLPCYAPDLWMDVDTAISEAPINIHALTDDTDFKSREESVTYNQAGLDLLWNFTTTAGAFSQTAVTPTDTGGAYDWVNQGNGYYTIEIPASGGGTINNDTEGFGWFSGYATGILPWRGPIIGFRKASMNNVMIDNGTLQDNLEDDYDSTGYAGGTIERKADLTSINGDDQSMTDLKDLADAGYDPSNDGINVYTVRGNAPLSLNDIEDNVQEAMDANSILADVTYGLSALETLVDDLETRLTATRAGYIDYLADGTYGLSAIETLVDDLETRVTSTRAGYWDNLASGVISAEVWAETTRTLTAFDEDDMTIDLDGTTVNATATVDEAALADAILDELLSGHTTSKSTAWYIKQIYDFIGSKR